MIPYNPAEELEMPLTTQSKRRSITDSERQWILKVAEYHHAGLWVKVMLYCGLRPGELCALIWHDIDFKKKLITIDKARESGSSDIKAPKTEAGSREIPIPDVLFNDMLKSKDKPFEPVFKQLTTDNPHTESSFYKSWHSFIRAMDIAMGAKLYRNQIQFSIIAPDLCPYCLRHTYCIDLETAGVPINVARYLMGHSDISVTSKIYTHTSEKTIEETTRKINHFQREIDPDNARNNAKYS